MRKEYSQDYLNHISQDLYGLGEVQKNLFFESGYDNSNMYIQTDQGEFVVKVYDAPVITEESIKFEVEIMSTCYTAGLMTPKIFKNLNGELYQMIDGKGVIVMNFLPGENMDRKKLSPEIAHSTGEQMALMHQMLEKFQDGSKTRQDYAFDGKTFLLHEHKMGFLDDSFDHDLTHQIFDEFRSKEKEFLALPTGLIHNDILSHNLLAENGELTGIIDFSDLAFSPYIQDIAVFLAQSLFWVTWTPELTRDFLDGFEKHKKLLAEEKDTLFLLVQCRYILSYVEHTHWNHLYGIDEGRNAFIAENYQCFLKFREFGEEKFRELLS